MELIKRIFIILFYYYREVIREKGMKKSMKWNKCWTVHGWVGKTLMLLWHQLNMTWQTSGISKLRVLFKLLYIQN